MATRFPYQTSADALTKPAKNATFFQGWTDADTLNHDLLCAEMSRLAYADEPIVRASLEKIGFHSADFLPGNVRGTEGFVARSDVLTVLAFRGTESDKFADIISDAEILQADNEAGTRVHAGFKKSYEIVKPDIAAFLAARTTPLLITGHSLGAALATLAAVDTVPAGLITFGSPQVGNATFKQLFDSRQIPAVRRFADCCDLVTRVPPARFDGPSFFTLFAELGNFASLPVLLRKVVEIPAKGAADALAVGFRGSRDSFVHVSPARYIRSDGSVADQSDAAQEAQDQTSARTNYHHTGGFILGTLKELLSALHAPTNPIADVRCFISRLFERTGEAPVPLRDLADHAPLNYVSAFTGRTQTPQ